MYLIYFSFQLILFFSGLAILVYLTGKILGWIITGIPGVASPKSIYRQILELAEIKNGEKLYDLGSGNGQFLLFGARQFGVQGIGYELSPVAYYWSKFKVKLSKQNIKIYRKSFFDADISDAQVVFCYLYPEVMAKLEKKFERELAPGSRVVSLAFALPNRQPVKIVSTNLKATHQKRILIYHY